MPLNAFLQDNCDPNNRGNIIAAGNLIDNLMGLVAVALMWVMYEIFGASPQQQFFVLFLMSFFILICSLRLIPQEFIRMIGIWCLQLVYRPRAINLERLPMRGGALLVVNRLNGDIENMQAKVKDAELELRVVQNLQSDINTEIANMNKESYIIAKARELDFLMPGEMRFVVVNPEVLEDTPEEAMVEEVKEE